MFGSWGISVTIRGVRPHWFSGLAGCLLLLYGVLVGGCASEPHSPAALAAGGPPLLADLAVLVSPGEDRAVLLGDGAGTFFYDRVAGAQDHPGMGFIGGGFRLLDGWRWWFPEDSLGLAGAEVSAGAVRPDFAVRAYQEVDTLGFLPRLIRRVRGPAPKRITEIISMAPRALVISVPDSAGVVELLPALSDRSPRDGYRVEIVSDGLVIARSNFLEPRQGDPRPVWVAVVGQNAQAARAQVDLNARFPGAAGLRERSHAVGRLRLTTPTTVAFAYGMTPEEAVAGARRALAQRDEALAARQQELTRVLERPGALRTEDPHFNRAFDWARLTLEQLVREDALSADLLTGIPGAEAQPGWNTILAMEGAFLVTGQWERAANMLRLYARNQRFDQRIDIFGRAPSRFTFAGSPVFSTADGAAALVAALGDYLRVTGDESLVLRERRLFWTHPVFAQRGYTDPRQLRTRDGFVRNRPNETWVQQVAARPDVPVRGPAAVEVQARYLDNLRTMERLARIMGVPRQAAAYADSARALQRRFQQAFVRNDHLADFVDEDGRADTTPRPSALVALRSFDLDPAFRRTALRRLAEQLAYPHGVATRPQHDDLFHPFLRHEEFFGEDEARYEGPVWTAFTGLLVSLLVEHGAAHKAFELTEYQTRLILERGIVGAIPENLDAHPRDGRIGTGGAPVQPWSLAEFLRNAYQDYAGIRYRDGSTVVLQPHLPQRWGETVVDFRMGNGWVRATMRQAGSQLDVRLEPRGPLPRNAAVRVRAFGKERHVPLLAEDPAAGSRPVGPTDVRITQTGITHDGRSVEADGAYELPDAAFWEGFSWVRPELQEVYPVMRRRVEERRLTPEQVTSINPTAIVKMAQTDPVGDDWGPTGTFTYPTAFPPGILDATYLQLAEDADAYYFRIEMVALARPDALGFQPTFFALTLDVEEGGQGEVGRNSGYRFPRGVGYNFVIFIGDGFRVEDERGRVLGEFQAGISGIFDYDRAVVEFALPKFVVPRIPRGSRLTLLVGANDGSAAPGRFQSVGAQATARRGGGRVNPRDPNVYDVVSGRAVR